MPTKQANGTQKPPSKVTPRRSSRWQSYTRRPKTATPAYFSLLDTVIGALAVVWTDEGIRVIQLPEQTEAATVDRALRFLPHAKKSSPPTWLRTTLKDLAAYLQGKESDLSRARLDWHGVPPFHRKVYEAARRVPAGETITYGGIARLIGSPAAARAVGQAMARNPLPLIVPCHRVVGSGGKAGGFSAFGGCDTKKTLLDIDRRLASSQIKVRKNAAAQSESSATVSGGTSANRAKVRNRSLKPSLHNMSGSLSFDVQEAVAYVRKSDKVMKALIDRVGDFRLQPQSFQSPFEALAESIVYQQLTGKAAATILRRVKELFNPDGGDLFFSPKDILAASESRLRSAGLSGAKTLALKDLALKTEQGLVPPAEHLAYLEDDEIIKRLVAIRGVGRWTVQMMLIFRFGKGDVLPVDDYGVRKAFALVYGLKELPKPKQLEAFGEIWRPYRTVASWYLWRALELPVCIAQSCGKNAKRLSPRL